MAVACVLAAALIAPAGASAGWLPATDISSESEFGFERVPEIAVGAPGEAVAVWPQLSGHYRVQASSKAPGGGWGAPVDISPPGEEGRVPQVAINTAGQAVALWYHLANDETIKAAVRTPQGAWGKAEVLSVPGYRAYAALDVAIDPAGNAAAIWVGFDDSDYFIQAATKPAGGDWTAPVELTDRGNNAWSPQLAVDPSGHVVAAWHHWTDAGDTVIEVAEKDPGEPWSEAEVLSLEGGRAILAKAATGGERSVVVWEREEIVEAAVKEADGEWQGPVELSEPESVQPSVGIDADGNAVAVWNFEGAEGPGEAESSLLPAGEEEWTEPVVLSERLAGEDALPQIAVDPAGRAVATWTAWNGSARTVEAASGTSAGDWEEPVTISPSNKWAQLPKVAMDAAGNAAAVWTGEPQTVQAAVLDVTGPELRALSIPASGRAGQPIAFAASPFDAWSPLRSPEWSFGDGSTAIGPSAVHDFQQPGRYRVTASTTDAAGHPATATGEIEIAPALAVAKRLVAVKKGKARIELACPGTAVCRGGAKLTRQVVSKKGRRHWLSLGETPFAVEPGGRKIVPVRLAPRALSLLADAPAKGLGARLTGDAVEARGVLLRQKVRR